MVATLPDGDEIKVSEKLGALDKLAKHLGLFTKHIHHSGEITTPVRAMSDEELLERASQLANRVAAHTSDNAAGPSPNGGS